MKLTIAAPLMYDSIVDGPGLRMVLWTQGCLHHCVGCHNPHTHELTGGLEIEHSEIIEQMRRIKLQRGLTLSGGEPFLQAEALLPIAQEARRLGLDVWCYTGYTWEQLNHTRVSRHQAVQELLHYVDVLVDGRFVQAMKRGDLRYRGSSNQRIIAVQPSLQQGEVVLAAY